MTERTIKMIPMDQIRVLNPRVRSRAKFRQIVHNIGEIGLKKPITVSVRSQGKEGNCTYDLVCGQGRLEAYQALGQKEVPALIVDVSEVNRYIMSLVENIARRQYDPVELIRELGALKKKGYGAQEISKKIGMTATYVSELLQLVDRGEQRLLAAVAQGRIPITVAISIASTDDQGAQSALSDAYESGKLRGKALLEARRLIEQRRASGRKVQSGSRAKRKLSADDLVRVYQKETSRQRLIVKKARLCETRLLFVVNALKDLFRDEAFSNLLRAEGLHTLPKYLADQLESRKS